MHAADSVVERLLTPSNKELESIVSNRARDPFMNRNVISYIAGFVHWKYAKELLMTSGYELRDSPRRLVDVLAATIHYRIVIHDLSHEIDTDVTSLHIDCPSVITKIKVPARDVSGTYVLDHRARYEELGYARWLKEYETFDPGLVEDVLSFAINDSGEWRMEKGRSC